MLWRKIGGFNLGDLPVRGCFRSLLQWTPQQMGRSQPREPWQEGHQRKREQDGHICRAGRSSKGQQQDGWQAHGWGQHVAFWRKKKWNIHILWTDTQFRLTDSHKAMNTKMGQQERKTARQGEGRNKALDRFRLFMQKADTWTALSELCSGSYFIHLFNKCLIRAYVVTYAVLDSGDPVANKNPPHPSLSSLNTFWLPGWDLSFLVLPDASLGVFKYRMGSRDRRTREALTKLEEDAPLLLPAKDF